MKLPDLVIALRIVLAFVALSLLSLPLPYPFAGLALTGVAIGLDGVDGYLARRLGIASDLGAVLDITGDRIVEHVFWIYFAVAGLVPAWIPLLIVSRSFAVDAVRGVALTSGKTAFGERTMQRSPLSRFLVASRTMRTAYGVGKAASFLLLGVLVLIREADGSAAAATRITDGVVLLTVAICVARALPVLWDARAFVRHRPPPAPRRRPLPSRGGRE
jgi:CDP-diacylglycerol--glycerol-3-phosphate 3-phosphatidyltransferase